MYLARVGEEIPEKATTLCDLFGPGRVCWFMGNLTGEAICSLRVGEETIVLRLNALGRQRGPMLVDPSKIPAHPYGDLSPDGNKLCFLTVQGRKNTLEVLDLSTGRLEKVMTVDGPTSPLSWSPDGKSIAYYFGTKESSKYDGYSVGVSELEAGQWNHTVIAPPSKPFSRSPMRPDAPVWGPEGKTLFFRARYQDQEVGPQWYTVSRDGSGLTHMGGGVSRPSCFRQEGVTYAVRKEGVFLRESRTGTVRKLFARKDVYSPKLSPDGKLIAYSDYHGTIFVARSDGSSPRKIMDTRGHLPAPPFYWVGSPDIGADQNDGKE